MTKKWLRMAEIYRRFSENNLDFSESAKKDMYEFESKGVGCIELGIFGLTNNGYYIGKHWMDVTISMWKEDMGTLIFREELDGEYPEWFLNKVLGKGQRHQTSQAKL